MMVRRLWAALLAAAFLLASQAAAMAENDSFFPEESSAFSLRFGMGAVVETDENQSLFPSTDILSGRWKPVLMSVP